MSLAYTTLDNNSASLVHTTYGEMANFIPPHVDDLAREVARSLLTQQARPDLLNAFFQQARWDV